MSDAEVVNNFATFIALAGAIPALAAALIFTLGKPRAWHRSLLGWVMAGLFLAIFIVYGIVLGRRIFGEYPGYQWVAVAGYSLLTLVLCFVVAIIIRERRRGRQIGFVSTGPIPHRKEKHHG